jgi:ribosome-binding factor A
MALPRRVERLKQFILETAAMTVQRDLADPRLGFVTLTRVNLAPDLTQATIFWSCLGTEAERRKSARALSDATGLIQNVVAKALATRTTPEITFRYDPTLEQAGHLETIFEKLKHEPGRPPAEDAPPAADASPAADDAAAAPDDDDDGEPPP